MVERFFNAAAASSIISKQQSECSAESGPITLLSGPTFCGKTSLVFQYALNMAMSDSEGYVVFLCTRRHFHANPPFLSQGVDPSSPIFRRIHIKYVDEFDDEALNKYFAAFHLLPSFPRAVIIDDFAHFFHDRNCQQRYNNPRGRDLAMVRVLALSHSAILHANKIANCQLLLSDTQHGDAPRLLFIYKRWISSILTIQARGPGSFLLKNTNPVEGSDKGNRTARYSVALQYLVLEGITEDGQL